MKNIILINGLIRDENVFLESLHNYLYLRDKKIIDEIIFSTDKKLMLDGNNTPVGNIMRQKIKKILESKSIKIIETENLTFEEIKKIDPIIESRPRNQLRKNTLSGLSLWRPMYGLKKIIRTDRKKFLCFKNKTRCYNVKKSAKKNIYRI